jgi:hypothetical protein
VKSNELVVLVSTPPGIVTQPVGDTLCEGDTLELSVEASGNNLTYRWLKGTTTIPGATSSTYKTAVTREAEGAYTVRVANGCGELLSNTVDVVINQFPFVTKEPMDVALTEGDTLVLTVVARGFKLTYQWYLNDSAIVGATESEYRVDSVGGVDHGVYYCVVTNDCGADTSDAAVVDITVGVTEDVAFAGCYLGSAVPNPARDNVEFTFEVPSSQQVTIVLSDVVGNVVATLADGTFIPGRHIVRVDALKLSLAPGVYTYTMSARGMVAAQQFVLVR